MWFTLALGITLILAPFALDYAHQPTALWTSLAFGVVMAVASAIKLYRQGRSRWEYYVAALAGLAAVATPLVLSPDFDATAGWLKAIVGVMAVFVALYPVAFRNFNPALR